MSVGWVYSPAYSVEAQAVDQKLAGEQPYGQVCRGEFPSSFLSSGECVRPSARMGIWSAM